MIPRVAGSRVCSGSMVSLFEMALGRAEGAASSLANRLWPQCMRWSASHTTPNVKPEWAPAPLQKKRTKPPLGWPRRTDSLCPDCVKEVRASILAGNTDWRILIEGHPGEIPADIVERDGCVLMTKRCAKHGKFEDVLSIDSKFSRANRALIPRSRLHRAGNTAEEPWYLDDSLRSRVGFDGGSHESLQHDV